MATTGAGGDRSRRTRRRVSGSARKPGPGAEKAERKRRTPARPSEPGPGRDAGLEAPAFPVSTPEPELAARVRPPVPPLPRPATRRVIFLDVENTSRPQHLAHVIDHLALDHRESAAELYAVANWKVVSHESARLLAQRGAQLVHSAPSTGVRDWSDLRIAVTAGIWLATAKPGDTIEIVSDDRAFDAVGDVAASLGVGFRRLSYRGLVRDEVPEPAAPERGPESAGGSRTLHRRRRGGRRHDRGRGLPSGSAHPRAQTAVTRPARPAPLPSEEPSGRLRGPVAAGGQAAEAHTAPHDALVSIVRELVAVAPGRRVSLDTLANALKSRGFRRPPGSPRLVTRLRRIREVAISPSGTITLRDEGPDEGREPSEILATDTSSGGPAGEPAEEERPGPPRLPESSPGRRRRRRRRRGGRRFPQEPAPVA